MPEILPANEPVSEAAAPKPPHRRLSGCAWVVICAVLIAATTVFTIGWPIYRANLALAELRAKGAEISHSVNAENRPWYLRFVDESVLLPGFDDVDAFFEGEQFTDDDMQDFIALGHFNDFGIVETSFTTDGLRELAHLHNVGGLYINHTDLSDDDLRQILQPHWRMYSIGLSSPKLTQRAWESIVRFKELDYVSLNCPGMTLNGELPDLSSMTSLDIVGLKEVHITAEGLNLLAALPKGPRYLHLYQCRMATVDFSMFPTLRALNLWGCDCSTANTSQLRIPSNVSPVRLNELSMVDSDPEQLARLSRVALVELNGSTFTDEHLHALASCTKLKTLNLIGCKHIGDAQIQLLLAIPNLQSLDLTNTSITAAGIRELKSKSPKLNVISHLPVERRRSTE